jgi:hypothetical protein
MYTYDGGSVDYEYHQMYPCARRVMAGNEYNYTINVSYAPGCGFDYTAKITVLTSTLPAGWNVSLTDSAGASCWGRQMDWNDSGYFIVILTVKSSLSANTGDAGLVSVRLWVNDTAACNEHDKVDINTRTIVDPYPNINLRLISPNGGETWRVGTLHNITWSATGGKEPLNITIEYTIDGYSGNWMILAVNHTNNGSFQWSLPATSSDQCAVRLFINDSDTPQFSRNTTGSYFYLRDYVVEMPFLTICCLTVMGVVFAVWVNCASRDEKDR